MQTHEECLAQWKSQAVSIKRQIGYFEKGRMRFSMNGGDRSEHQVAALKKVLKSLEKLLEIYGERLPA